MKSHYYNSSWTKFHVVPDFKSTSKCKTYIFGVFIYPMLGFKNITNLARASIYPSFFNCYLTKRKYTPQSNY